VRSGWSPVASIARARPPVRLRRRAHLPESSIGRLLIRDGWTSPPPVAANGRKAALAKLRRSAASSTSTYQPRFAPPATLGQARFDRVLMGEFRGGVRLMWGVQHRQRRRQPATSTGSD